MLKDFLPPVWTVGDSRDVRTPDLLLTENKNEILSYILVYRGAGTNTAWEAISQQPGHFIIRTSIQKDNDWGVIAKHDRNKGKKHRQFDLVEISRIYASIRCDPACPQSNSHRLKWIDCLLFYDRSTWLSMRGLNTWYYKVPVLVFKKNYFANKLRSNPQEP